MIKKWFFRSKNQLLLELEPTPKYIDSIQFATIETDDRDIY